MKKHILIFVLLFSMPVFVHSITDEGITISKLSMKPVPFNERRDPFADSPYNAFDGDIKTAALYSDFTIEFSKPLSIDQIRIINGNASAKELYKRDNRERDIEIILYTVDLKPEKKAADKKNVKPEKKDTIKPADKKEIEKQSKDKIENNGTGNIKKDNPVKNTFEKDKTEKKPVEKEKNGKDDKEDKKTDLPEKVVMNDEYESFEAYYNDDVKLVFAVSESIKKTDKENNTVKKETAVKKSTENKPSAIKNKKNDKKKPEDKKKGIKKNPDKKNDKKSKPVKDKKAGKKILSEKKASVKAEPERNKSDNKNIIEITDSKKSKLKLKNESAPLSSKNEYLKKELKPDTDKKAAVATGIKKTNSDDDKTDNYKNKKTEVKKKVPEEKNIVTKNDKKKTVTEKKKQDKSKTSSVKSEKKKSEKTVTDKTKIEITDSKNKTADKKQTSADKYREESAKDSKATTGKNENGTVADEEKTVTIDPDKPAEKVALPDIKIENKKNEKKPAVKKHEKINSKDASNKKDSKTKKEVKTENKNNIVKKKEDKKENIKSTPVNKTEGIKPADEVKINKMKGIVKIENDKAGRVLVYTTLKDSMEYQNIDLKGKYTVTKIDFRTRDDEYYSGNEPDRAAVTEIAFMNRGKRIPVKGIDTLKKLYIDRFIKNLEDSLSGETFIMNEFNDTTLRMKFKKDGSIEFFDRFKCKKKGDSDCTSVLMPDRWKVSDGRLLMRYHTLWRVWKYELDSQSDMLDDKQDRSEPPRWMKIYFKSENGFSDKYLDLKRSEKGLWAE